MIDWSSVVAIAPQLSTVATGIQSYALNFADAQIDDDAWGDPAVADMGRAALAAHLAASFSAPGSSVQGPLTSETVGPMSRSYAALQMSLTDSYLSTTKYGLLYLQLLENTPGALGFVP